ncbi:MAG: hypothetical protein KA797_00735 [Chitinophagales bacterium]|nr:hypothetical protein [Chitinophagales bacterium]
MKYILSTAIALALFSCKQESLKFEKAKDELYSANSAPASVSASSKEVICKSQFFKYLEIGKEKKPVLVSVQQSNSTAIQSGEQDGEIEVKGFARNGDAFSKEAYSKKFRADIINFEPRYMQLIRSARGENEEVSTLVNYFTGEELMDFTGPNAFFAIPNQEEKRMIGFLAQANDLGKLKDESNNTIGILNYASTNNKIQSIKIKAKNVLLMRSIQKFTPGIVISPLNEEDKVLDDGRTVILSSIKENFSPEKISNIIIELTFFLSVEQREVKITIPLNSDKLDLDKAIYDKGMFEMAE